MSTLQATGMTSFSARRPRGRAQPGSGRPAQPGSGRPAQVAAVGSPRSPQPTPEDEAVIAVAGEDGLLLVEMDAGESWSATTVDAIPGEPSMVVGRGLDDAPELHRKRPRREVERGSKNLCSDLGARVRPLAFDARCEGTDPRSGLHVQAQRENRLPPTAVRGLTGGDGGLSRPPERCQSLGARRAVRGEGEWWCGSRRRCERRGPEGAVSQRSRRGDGVARMPGPRVAESTSIQ